APIVNHITPTEASVLMESEKTLVLDVREKDAFEKGHLPNAVSVPIGELNKRLDEFHALKAEEVVVYCNDGSTRGPRATKQLNDAGFSKAKNLRGGAEGWKRASLQLVAF
ncbi:MAG: rhodanese-like domain-containing protein, partial [Proteobacteria bacterium]|nr:rhodanese-like domain-containing protein [Pseudomonadota bacterium]